MLLHTRSHPFSLSHHSCTAAGLYLVSDNWAHCRIVKTSIHSKAGSRVDTLSKLRFVPSGICFYTVQLLDRSSCGLWSGSSESNAMWTCPHSGTDRLYIWQKWCRDYDRRSIAKCDGTTTTSKLEVHLWRTIMLALHGSDWSSDLVIAKASAEAKEEVPVGTGWPTEPGVLSALAGGTAIPTTVEQAAEQAAQQPGSVTELVRTFPGQAQDHRLMGPNWAMLVVVQE